ncbi:MAG: DUF1700 domain-containing protein [Acidimicrobiia bacterium]|nr:DUF1700 domain-containing protein [Acidimicrobiia bacterium]MDH4306315.1 DUF1700 domain-containing protein [Acidimicrobiia bacterium]MDH5294738.1 DUF1700 domain-containing protein [Acidimicrobiia bacterium]
MKIDVTLSRAAVEYLEAVRSGLRDLDEEDREAILSELEEHLGELGSQDPTEALGDAGAFVSEFRHSAGIVSRPGLFRRTAMKGRRTLHRVAEHPAAAPWHRHRSDLRIVWVWTRGWIAMSAIWWLGTHWPGGQISFLIPWGRFLGWGSAMAGLATVASVWVDGRRSDRRWRHLDIVATAATVVLALFALLNPVWIDDPWSEGSQVLQTVPEVSNVYAYDREGNPVEVLLYDQNGRPFDVNPDPGSVSFDGAMFYDWWGPVRYRVDRYGAPVTNLYPLERMDDSRQTVPPPRVGLPDFGAAESTPTTTDSTPTTVGDGSSSSTDDTTVSTVGQESTTTAEEEQATTTVAGG